MSWDEAALWWLPTIVAAAVSAFAVVALARQPWRPARKYWLAAMTLVGVAATTASAWQQATSGAAVGRESARQRERDDRAAATLSALNARVKELEGQIVALQEKSRGRSIDADTATKVADYLRPLGSQRVVVSCPPDDDEAYSYANQIANMLSSAGWEALGPETTTIFGEGSAMGVTLYVRPGTAPPDAARLLLDAFTRFNIPYQAGVGANDAIPDPATVELFVGRKP